MSIILGLSAAICWGVTDFLARYASRELGAYRSLFFMQAFGLGLLSAVWLARNPGTVLHASGAAWAWTGLAGIMSAATVLAKNTCVERNSWILTPRPHNSQCSKGKSRQR